MINISIEDIKKNPYESILTWADNRLKITGRLVYEILALMPCSLILPDIPYQETTIPANIHAMFLCPPGGGKDSAASSFEEVAYNPLHLESITPAKIEERLFEERQKDLTLITADCSRIMKDFTLMKIYERIISEKKVQREHMHKERNFYINVITYNAGVPQDLASSITSGLIFRVYPLIILHKEEEKERIGGHIRDNLFKLKGEIENINITEIKNYYKILQQIQLGDWEKIPMIRYYDVSEKIKTEIFNAWNGLNKQLGVYGTVGWEPFRELHNAFRYLVSSAFLNIFNRKVTKITEKDGVPLGMLTPDEKDMELAIYLLEKEINFKRTLLKCDALSKKFKSVNQFNDYLKKSDKTFDKFKMNLFKLMLEGKRGG